MDWIRLNEFRVPCVIGLLEREQRTPQPLAIELALGLDLEPAAGGELSKTIDYAATLSEVMFLAQHGRWRLLESLAAAIARWVLLPKAACEQRANVLEVVVTLAKPEALDGVARPAISITRSAAWCVAERRRVAHGITADVLQETSSVGAYRLCVPAHTRFDLPQGMIAQFVCGSLSSDGQDVALRTSLLESARAALATGADETVLIAISRPALR